MSDIKGNVHADTNNNTLVTVQAMLCWSEYYNGKWQAPKTSDINQPVTVGQFNPAGPDAFDRSQMTISVNETADPLRVLVSSRQAGSSAALFLFYNTRSLPLRGQIYPSISLGKQRALPAQGNQLEIDYINTPNILHRTELDRIVLTDQMPFTTTAPTHQLQNVWDAPFFFQDSRHVFYVTTEEQQVWIYNYPRYGVLVNQGIKQVAKIPPLIVQPGPEVSARPKFWGDGGPVGPNPGDIDPAPMQQFVTEDAYIRQGIGSTGAVMYGGVQVGPAGALANGRAQA